MAGSLTPCPTCGFHNAARVKFCAECGQQLGDPGAGAGEVRRTVSVLFADVSGSTALGERLDPEALRALLGRYFGVIKGIVEHHGGTVEKFIGDAVMAVFGIPTRHEDDALRAVRAAAEIRDTLAQLNAELQQRRGLAIVFRTGVNSGEVVAGDPSVGQTLVTGDTVNTAARLEQATAPGEILLGQATYALVRDAVLAEPSDPIVAKGKAQPLSAYRLLSVTPGAAGHARRLDAPMLGRDHELQLLSEAFERCVAERSAQLVTLLGEAGVGKSRLVHEFRQQVAGQATVLVGRCLSYGEGLTYWPLADALRTAVAVDDDHVVASWRSGLLALIAGQPQAEAIVAQVMGLLGVGEAAGSGEAFWAVRRLLQGMARQKPIVLVIDDLHWATPTLLDLVEHLAGWSRDAPILLLGVARPELLEARPGWGGGQLNASTLALEALDAGSVDALLAHLLGSGPVGADVQRRIAAAAEGNPLFVEELVAMLAERGELGPEADGRPSAEQPAELEVPATIEALMAARLDQLPSHERAVLGRGSVVGKQFGAGEVAHLSEGSGPISVRPALMAMVRRDLLRPDPDAMLPMGAEDEGFQFRHQLIRDGTYAGLSKAERARLHERYARWLEQLPAARLSQLDEIVGYHLEQAHRLWTALGGEPGAPDTAARAATHLAAAGLRAAGRNDVSAAINLLSRAAALMDEGRERSKLLLQVGRILAYQGDFAGARRLYLEVAAAAARSGDELMRQRAELDLRADETFTNPNADPEPTLAIADRVEALGREEDDADSQIRAELARWLVSVWQCRWMDALHALQRTEPLLQRSGDPRLSPTVKRGMCAALQSGPVPAHEALARISELSQGTDELEVVARSLSAPLRAMVGRTEEARADVAAVRAYLQERGLRPLEAELGLDEASVEWIAGDLEAAERALSNGIGILQSVGETGVLSTLAAWRANVLQQLGRREEAEAAIQLAQENGSANDIATQVDWRGAAACIAADAGRLAEAQQLVNEAIELVEPTDSLELRARAFESQALVAARAGRPDEWRRSLDRSVAELEAKGDVVSAARIRDRIAAGPPEPIAAPSG